MNSSPSRDRSKAPGPEATRDDLAENDDERLVAALRCRDLAGARKLYERFATPVERVVRHRLGRDADVDDIVQEVFLTAFVSADSLREPNALRGWLLGIAVSKARDHARSRWRRRWLEYVPAHLLPDPPARNSLSHDAQCDVASILNRLGTEEREVLLARRFEQLSLAETAEARGLSLATLKRRFRRAESKFIACARLHPALSPWLQASL